MRKLYTSLTAILFCTVVSAQSDQSLQQNQLTTLEKQEKLSGITNQVPVQNRDVSGSCDSLTNELLGGNSFHGNMFDVVALNTVTLETFSVTVDAGAWNIAIYYRPGSYVGFNLSSAGWIFLDSAMVNGAGLGNKVKVPVDVNLTLNASSTYAFYVTGTNAGITFNYTNGVTVGDLHSSNSDLEIYEGHGGEYPFNLNNSPRVFNGSMHYCAGGIGVNELEIGQKFDVYPNPSSENITIDLSSYAGQEIPLTIHNSIGEVVYSENTVAAGIKTISVASFPQGVYMVDAIINNQLSTSRFVVAK